MSEVLNFDASSSEPHGGRVPHCIRMKARARSVVWRWLRRLAVVLLLVFVGWNLSMAARVWWLRDHNPATTSFMDLALIRLQRRNPEAQLRHSWVSYGNISPHLKRAVIAAEDQRFLDHDGLDWEAIENAYQRNLARPNRLRGGSTISQQLAKNLFLSGSRTYVRKAQEALITLLMERLLTKRRILEVYLNVIEWGNGVYGAEAAAQHYFGVTAAALSPEQAARLAAMIPKPRFYDRNRSTPYLESRTELLLSLMERAAVP